MPNFFSKILKQKKTIFFVLFFLVISGMLLPKPVFALGFWCKVSMATTGVVGDLWGCGTVAGLKELGTEFLKAMVLLLLNGSSTLASFIGDLFSQAFSGILNWGITYYTPFRVGWTASRDFSNMLIVLGFVVVGIATTLRIQDYHAKRLLPKLILVALLINFSNVFVGVIVDASNITMNCFVNGACGNGTSAGSASSSNLGTYYIIPAIRDFTEKNLTEEVQSDAVKFVAAAFQSILMYVVVILVFGYMLLVMFERYIMLGILFILAPLAFVAWIFPATKKYWDMWWEHLLKWAFIGVGAGFFLWIAQKLITDPSAGKPVSNFYLFLVLIFLFISYKLISKSSGIAKAVIGMAKTGAMMAIGGGLAIAGGVGLKGLAQRAGTATKDKVTSAGERMGLVAKGTTALNQKSRTDKVSKGLEAAFGDNPEGNTALAKLASGRTATAYQREQKTAAAELLAKRKAFVDYVAKDKQESVAAYATARGVAKETFTKERPDLLTGITSEGAKGALITEEKAKLEQTYAGTSATPAQKADLIKKNLSKYEANMSPEMIAAKKREMAKAKTQETKLGAIPVADADVTTRAKEDYAPTAKEISDEKFIMGAGATDEKAMERLRSYYKPDTSTLIKTKEKLTKERAQEKAFDFKFATRDEARNDLIDKEAKRLREEKGLSGSALDTQIKKYSDNLTSANVETGLTDLNTEKKSKAIKKLGVAKLRDVPEPVIDADVIEHSNYGTFNRAWLEFNTEQKEKYAKLLPEIRSKLESELSAQGIKPGADKDDIKAAVSALKALSEDKKNKNRKKDQETYKKVRELINKESLIYNG